LRTSANSKLHLVTALFHQGLLESSHGHKWMLFERGRLVKLLMDHPADMPNQLILNKHVTSISSSTDTIDVNCSDGSSYSASILIGADGINSTARSFIDGASTAIAIANDEDCYSAGTFTTTFYGVYGHGTSLPSMLEDQVVFETHFCGFSSQLIV
jgi:2-polyprenyl-6-methoxyphenol hydroxylase-like FAD-dependent oxidoreductase